MKRRAPDTIRRKGERPEKSGLYSLSFPISANGSSETQESLRDSTKEKKTLSNVYIC